ncbi:MULTISPECIES: hypothetical protein [Arthrobacter]|uniref:hypothetical protein n=1 Tax=Arthrobacter TaxID=1663 RepID=UPI001D1376D8|nr:MULTISPECIES: hypothetical protein [Arthrobacter]MCC3281284.1 hypothetical protein [Arthrobacter caoxuetaonis]MCC9192541.1 hypothetical protein [Arthrobacter sp. zg-Y916]
MIDALLRRPASGAEVVSDAVRLLGAASLLAALLLYGPVEAALFALVLMGLLVSRCLPAAPLFDSLYGLTLLVAAWSSVLDLYASISWWDLAVHFAATGTIAVMAWYLLAGFGVVTCRPSSGRILPAVAVPAVVVSLGLALSVLWEFGEWWGHTYVDDTINVGYQDTMGDLAAGGLGALLSGVLLARLLRREQETAPGLASGAPLQRRFQR